MSALLSLVPLFEQPRDNIVPCAVVNQASFLDEPHSNSWRFICVQNAFTFTGNVKSRKESRKRNVGSNRRRRTTLHNDDDDNDSDDGSSSSSNSSSSNNSGGSRVGGKVFATNPRNGVEAQCFNNDAIVETNNTYSCALPSASPRVSCLAESNE
ncbi:hypothetical protein M0804_003606 [Polistes exclamans]|nr:hypothetical protein M0804_003606 [Polistes exclamans]